MTTLDPGTGRRSLCSRRAARRRRHRPRYQACDSRLNRLVALKVLSSALRRGRRTPATFRAGGATRLFAPAPQHRHGLRHRCGPGARSPLARSAPQRHFPVGRSERSRLVADSGRPEHGEANEPSTVCAASERLLRPSGPMDDVLWRKPTIERGQSGGPTIRRLTPMWWHPALVS